MAGKPAALTPRQLEAYEALCSFIRENGYSPTYRELAEILSVCHSTAREIIDGMIDRGVVSRIPNRHRSLSVV